MSEIATELPICIQNDGVSSDVSSVIPKLNDVASTSTTLINKELLENIENQNGGDSSDDSSVVHKSNDVVSNKVNSTILNNELFENNEILEQLEDKFSDEVPLRYAFNDFNLLSNSEIQETTEDAFTYNFKNNYSFNSSSKSSLFDYHIAEVMDLNPDSSKLFLNVLNKLESLENEVNSIKGENKLLSADLRIAKTKLLLKKLI